MVNFFYFQNNIYGRGTTVKIAEKHQHKFKFNTTLIFEEYDNTNDVLYFRTLYDKWDRFSVHKNEFEEYIEQILSQPGEISQNYTTPKVQEEYIEGITSAWIWYIIVMVFGLFLKGVGNVICTWVIASIIFFSWRHKKMNGD